MIVQLQCHCHWSERTQLILGNSVSPLVRDLIFVDKLQPQLQPAVSLFQKNEKGICLDKKNDSTYRIVLSSKILFSMVQAGSGQARFDELIVSARKAICELQLCNCT